MTLTKDLAMAMLAGQELENRKDNSKWLYAGYPFLRGVVVKAGDAIEHQGWKWWKPQRAVDAARLQPDLVDMWGFILSDFIVRARGDLEYAASAMASAAKPHHGVTGHVVLDGVEYRFGEHKLAMRLELLAGLAIGRRVSLPLFESLMAECGLDWEALADLFLGRLDAAREAVAA